MELDVVLECANRTISILTVDVTVAIQIMGRAASSPAHTVPQKIVRNHWAVHVSKYK